MIAFSVSRQGDEIDHVLVLVERAVHFGDDLVIVAVKPLAHVARVGDEVARGRRRDSLSTAAPNSVPTWHKFPLMEQPAFA